MKKYPVYLSVFFIALIIPFLTNAAAPTSGLVGHWRLDEQSGTQVFDSTGSGITGSIINGGVKANSKINNGIVFDGVDDYLDMGDLPAFEQSSFSVSVWVKRNGAQADWVRIFSKGYAGGAPWGSFKLEFDGTSDTILDYSVGFTDNSVSMIRSKTPLVDGVWTNYIATYDGTTIKLYVNGTQEGSISAPGKTVMYDNVPLTLGGYNGFGYFKGELDEVRFYNRALSNKEVVDLYLSENTLNQNIEVYPGPGREANKSDLYTVEVLDGTTWVPAYVYKASRKSLTHWHNGMFPSVNFLTLGSMGPVNVRVRKIAAPITSIEVSPKSKNIQKSVAGGTATLTLNQNDKAWITVDGDDANPLFIFVDNLKPAVPAGATYFGPGVVDIALSNNNRYVASSNEIIYLDGGAWVKGNIDVRGKTNVQIMGPGVLSGETWPAESLASTSLFDYRMIVGTGASSEVASIKNITILNSPTFNISAGTNDVYGVKLISPWYFATDGFQSGVRKIDQSFAFIGDNVFFPAWAGLYGYDSVITNSFAATTNNGVIVGGYHGNSLDNTNTSLVDNIDIKSYLNNTFVTQGWTKTPAAIQLWVDNNTPDLGFQNQTYQNIRVEGNVDAPLIELKNIVHPWTGPGISAPNPPLGNTYNIVLKNISLEGNQSFRSEIKGYDLNNKIQNVTLDNVTINGTQVTPSNVSTYFDISDATGIAYSPVAPPTVSMSASQTTINSGSSITITWSSTNASSCVASGDWTGTKAVSGSQIVSPLTTSVYYLTCTGTSGFVTPLKKIKIIVNQSTPIGMWALDQLSGTIAMDTSGNNNGTLINGPTWVAGKVSNALNFDGIDDQVKISSVSGLNDMTEMTISTWINPRSGGGAGTGLGRIISKGDNAGTVRYTLMLGSDNSSIRFNSGFTGAGGSWVTPSGSIQLNNWSHVVVVYSHGDVASIPQIYINGVLQTLTTLATPSGTPIPDDTSLYIGSRGINNLKVFDGIIDQLRIYNRKLVQSEVTSIFNSESSNADSVPPIVSVVSPVSSTTVSGAVTISANATDNVGVAGVQFAVNGVNQGLEDTVSPYSISWDTTTVANGAYGIAAIARDLAGNKATSTTVSVVVNNLPKNKFKIGDVVRATARINVRSTANGTRIGTQSTGAQGSITNGPTTSGGLIWWRVDFNTGVDGWVAESNIASVTLFSAKITSTLGVGSSGKEVSLLQETLKKLGYYSNGITGYFGELTKAAVTQFQTANSLEAVGIVGPKTRALLINNQ